MALPELIVETLGRTLDQIAKYSWALLVVCVVVLFAPDPFAEETGFNTLREDYKPWPWVLLFSGVLSVAQLGIALRAPVAAHLVKRRRQQQRAEAQATLQQRLDSLSDEETSWILPNPAVALPR